MARLTQQQLLNIFNALKHEMRPFEKAPVKARMDIEGKYDLWSEKEGMVILGKPRQEMSFATIIVQSNYVGFYYMPIYCNRAAIEPLLSAALMSTLKGKACFHIKELDEQLIQDVRHAMKIGYEGYKEMGWV